MLRQGFGHTFSPCVKSREVLAFTGSRMDALRGTGLGWCRIMCLFAEIYKNINIALHHFQGICRFQKDTFKTF